MKKAKSTSPVARKIYQLKTANKSLTGQKIYLTPPVSKLRAKLKHQRFALMYSAGPRSFIQAFQSTEKEFYLIKKIALATPINQKEI